jgi:hypothetical protein
MQRYDIKKGHFRNLEAGKLKELMKEIFGEVKEHDEKIETSYCAFNRLIVWTEGKGALFVDAEMNKKADDDTASNTIRAYNDFLKRATGFTSKERRKRLTKKVKEGKS